MLGFARPFPCVCRPGRSSSSWRIRTRRLVHVPCRPPWSLPPSLSSSWRRVRRAAYGGFLEMPNDKSLTYGRLYHKLRELGFEEYSVELDGKRGRVFEHPRIA